MNRISLFIDLVLTEAETLPMLSKINQNKNLFRW